MANSVDPITASLLSIPAPLDILCGRGRGYFDHPGNRRMLDIIHRYKADYQTASKIEKTEITKQVVKLIQNTGSLPAKFLKQVDDKDSLWFELTEKEVHKKVAHTLREHKSIIKQASSESLKRIRIREQQTSDVSAASDLLQPGSQQIDELMYVINNPLSIPNKPEYIALTMTREDSVTSSLSVPVSEDDTSSQSSQDSNEDENSCHGGGPLSFKREPSFDASEIGLMLDSVLEDDGTHNNLALSSTDTLEHGKQDEQLQGIALEELEGPEILEAMTAALDDVEAEDQALRSILGEIDHLTDEL